MATGNLYPVLVQGADGTVIVDLAGSVVEPIGDGTYRLVAGPAGPAGVDGKAGANGVTTIVTRTVEVPVVVRVDQAVVGSGGTGAVPPPTRGVSPQVVAKVQQAVGVPSAGVQRASWVAGRQPQGGGLLAVSDPRLDTKEQRLQRQLLVRQGILRGAQMGR